MLHDIINNRVLGELANIAREGLMVICDEMIESHTILQLSFKLPSPISNMDSLNIGVDCLWCRKIDNFHRYWAGFEIIDACDETVLIIDTLIKNYADKHL